MPVANVAYAAQTGTDPLAPWNYEIRDPLDSEILIEVLFCGICHSDIHTVHGDWYPPTYPVVPGHEFTGLVSKAGSKVQKFKVGDRVGVGCLVNSCRNCDACKRHLENYCDRLVFTYDGVGVDGKQTYGGYGQFVVVDENYAVSIPESLPMDKAAPLLCAGITTYSPIVHHGMNKGGLMVGVIGLGGLGHMAVQFAAAFGNTVYVMSRSAGKKELALELGAKDVVLTDKEENMAPFAQHFDFIIDTVSAGKALAPYMNMLKLDGVLVMVGLPAPKEYPILPVMPMIMRRRAIEGSCIGGIKETQDMINFCAAKKVMPYIEKISCDQVNEAYKRVIKSDVKFRFVMDVKNTHPKRQ